MDIITYILSTTFTKNALKGIGFVKGSPCVISSIVDNLDGTHDITFSWKDNTDVTHTSVLTVKDGETKTTDSLGSWFYYTEDEKLKQTTWIADDDGTTR